MTSIKPEVPASSLRDTIILQCLAALLIANSHLEGLYPHSCSWMAADGLLGNSLFFFLSGYGLVKSERKNHRPFLKYYWRRVVRIYPALWLVVILFQLGWGEKWQAWGPADYFHDLIYPTGYGYIRQIMVFYIPFYFLARLQRPKVMMWLGLGLSIPYLARYLAALPPGGIIHLKLGTTDIWLWDMFYFQMMLWGGYCGFQPGGRSTIKEKTAIWLLVISFVVYVGLKFAMVVTGSFIPGTSVPLSDFFIILIFLTAVIVLLMFQVFTSSAIAAWVATISPLKWLVTLAGGLTLEIYLSHEFIAYNSVMEKIPFPLNLISWLTATLGASWLIGKWARQIQKRLELS